jgi:hypothetical protein
MSILYIFVTHIIWLCTTDGYTNKYCCTFVEVSSMVRNNVFFLVWFNRSIQKQHSAYILGCERSSGIIRAVHIYIQITLYKQSSFPVVLLMH